MNLTIKDWSLTLLFKQDQGDQIGNHTIKSRWVWTSVYGSKQLGLYPREYQFNTPDIFMVKIGEGVDESETKQGLDETGTPYHSFESLGVENDNLDSEDSLAAADESKFEGDEVTINDNSGKSEFDSIGGQGQVNDDRLQDRHQ